MSSRTTLSFWALGSYAALQLATGCMQGDNTGAETDELALQHPATQARPDAGMQHGEGAMCDCMAHGGMKDGMHADGTHCDMMKSDGGMSHGGMTHGDAGMKQGGMTHGDAGMNHGGADTGHTGMDHGGAPDAAPTNEMGDAPCPPDFPRFAPGVTKVGDLTVKVVSLAPQPPRQKVANDWELEIVDAAGAPVTGAMITNADSYMAVHLHYGKAPPKVEVLAAPGRFKLDNIDFKMRGPWEVLFDLQANGGKAMPVSIKVCVE